MESSFMETEVFEHVVSAWTPVKPEKNIYKLVFCWFSVDNTSELWISRVWKDVWQCGWVNMENIKSYLQLCNYSRLFSSFTLLHC